MLGLYCDNGTENGNYYNVAIERKVDANLGPEDVDAIV